MANLVALLLASSLVGCGPRGEELFEVRGQVELGGAPLTTGVVSLRADRDNKTPHHPTGLIDSQGHYQVFTSGQPGAPPGWYRVVIFATEATANTKQAHPGLPKSLIPRRYNDAGSTPLSIEVKRDATAGAFDLKLTPGA